MSIMAKLRRRRRQRSCWTRSWLLRREHSISSTLVRELIAEDGAEYRGMFRMQESDFQFLLNLVSPIIAKQDTLLRESIPATERLQVTLRYLATGIQLFCFSTYSVVHSLYLRPHVVVDGGILFFNRSFFFFRHRIFEVDRSIGNLYSSHGRI